MLRACHIASIKNVRLILESSAIVYSYIREHQAQLESIGSRRIVVFVDIGHSKTSITVAVFDSSSGKTAAKILFKSSAKNFGGRNLDWKVLEHVSDELEREHQLDEGPKNSK